MSSHFEALLGTSLYWSPGPFAWLKPIVTSAQRIDILKTGMWHRNIANDNKIIKAYPRECLVLWLTFF